MPTSSIRHSYAMLISLALFVLSLIPLTQAQAVAVLPGNTNFDKVLFFDGANFIDLTTAASNATTNDVPLAASLTGNSIYFGLQSPFDAVYFQMGTWGNPGGASLTYQYSTSDGFLTIVPTSNPSNNFKTVDASGNTELVFSASNWGKQTINGVTAFWFRIVTENVFTTIPRANVVKARAPALKIIVKDEVGNFVPGATVTFDGAAPAYAASGTYYFSTMDVMSKALTVAANGYIAESVTGTSGNTALGNVSSGSSSTQTVVNLSGGLGAVCQNSIPAGSSATCQALLLDTRFSVKNSNGTNLAGATVTFYTDANRTVIANDLSKTGTADAVASTNSSGEVRAALATGTYYYRVTATNFNEALGTLGVTSGILNTGSVTLTASQNQICSGPVAVGSLIKLPDDGNASTQFDSAVYYFGKDCLRHPFPHEKVYFTWYPNFTGITIVSSQLMSTIPLGKNVTYRPGVKMVKFQTLNNVYAVSKGGVLHWIKTESLASSLYGTDWNKKIDDINDAFFSNYSFGADINVASDYNIVNELQSALTINDNL